MTMTTITPVTTITIVTIFTLAFTVIIPAPNVDFLSYIFLNIITITFYTIDKF